MATISREHLGSLSNQEKLELIEVLWDSLDAGALPFHDWQKKELDQALEEYRLNPEEGEEWEVVRAHIERNLEDRQQNHV
ncbi:MAG: addiction module protein [Pseudomonadota bacterium]|nr:addiction module protein [Pseudomonadota bacterium]